MLLQLIAFITLLFIRHLLIIKTPTIAGFNYMVGGRFEVSL